MEGPLKEWDMEGPPRNELSELSATRYLLFTFLLCRRYRCWKCFPDVALPLIVSWQSNGDSGLAFGRGTSFPSPGPHLSRSRTLRSEPDSLSCLVGALKVFSYTLGTHRVRASIPA